MKKKILVLCKDLKKNKNNEYIYVNKYLKPSNSKDHYLPLNCENKNNLLLIEKLTWKIYNQNIRIFKNFFNYTLNINHSLNDYHVLLGTFFFKVSRLIAGRKIKLDNHFLKNNFDEIAVSDNTLNLKFNNSLDFSNSIVKNDVRNIHISELISKYIINLKLNEFKFKKYKQYNKVLKQTNNLNKDNDKIISSLKNYFKICLAKLTFRDNDLLFYNSFLGFKDNLNLQLKLNQIPSFIVLKKNKIFKFNQSTRKEQLNFFLNKFRLNKKEKIYFQIFYELLPTCYFEGFIENYKLGKKNFFFNKSNLIFTSNAHEYDEEFKFSIFSNSLAKNVIIGQHGCNYGTAKYRINPAIEELIFRNFLTWGWKNHKKNIRGFNFITNKIRRKTQINNDRALLVLNNMRGEFLYDENYDYENELKNNCELTNILSKKFSHIKIKPHVNFKNFYDEEKIYKKLNLHNVDIVQNSENLEKLINDGDFLLFTYDSTDFYKCLIKNRPCIVFLNMGFFNIKKKYHKYFNYLEDAKIVFKNFEDLSKHLDDIISSNIHEWWNDKKTQKNIWKFNSELNVKKNDKIEFLKQFFKSQII